VKGWAEVPLITEEMILACSTVNVGIKIPVGAEEQFTEGDPWDVSSSKASKGFDWPWRRLWKQWRKGWSYL